MTKVVSAGQSPSQKLSILISCTIHQGETHKTCCKCSGGALLSIKDKQKPIPSSWGYLTLPIFPCEKWGRKLLQLFWSVMNVLLRLAHLLYILKWGPPGLEIHCLPSFLAFVYLTSSHARIYSSFYSWLGNELQWSYKDKRPGKLAKIESLLTSKESQRGGGKTSDLWIGTHLISNLMNTLLRHR